MDRGPRYTIKQLRESKYMTQRELARDLGLHYMTIHKWENFKSSPSMKNIVKVANYFRIPPESIVRSYREVIGAISDQSGERG